MKCQVTLRACGVARQWDLNEWSVVVLLAALSADPETFAEMDAALRRYQPAHRLFELGRPVAAEDDMISIDAPAAGVFPGENRWCLIDLVGQTVVAGGGLVLPEIGKASAFEEKTIASMAEDPLTVGAGPLCPVGWLDLADTWLFRLEDDHWQAIVAARARAACQQPRIDTRRVLFGFPLLQFLAERVISLVAARGSAAANSLPDDTAQTTHSRRIHADWLLTKRDDLGGVTPRQVLLADHDRIQRDLEHRVVQWMIQGFPPPALPGDSDAYRFGSYGIIEVMHYFVLVRALLAEAWRRVKSDRSLVPEALVQKLAAERERWLVTPLDEATTETPAEWIESERRRLSIVEERTHLDGNGSICRAPSTQASSTQDMSMDQTGPIFRWFEDHLQEMEDEFAFSLIRLRHDWEQEQGYGAN